MYCVFLYSQQSYGYHSSHYHNLPLFSCWFARLTHLPASLPCSLEITDLFLYDSLRPPALYVLPPPVKSRTVSPFAIFTSDQRLDLRPDTCLSHFIDCEHSSSTSLSSNSLFLHLWVPVLDATQNRVSCTPVLISRRTHSLDSLPGC